MTTISGAQENNTTSENEVFETTPKVYISTTY